MFMVEVVSAEKKAKIDFRVLVLILVGVSVFQIVINSYLEDDEIENAIIVVSLISQLATAIAALLISKRYWGSHVFGKSYLALSFAYFSVFLGEILYNVYAFVLEIDPYPSIADVSFFLLYPFAAIHLILNIRFFQPKVQIGDKVWLIAFPIALTLFYITFSFQIIGETNFDFYYGIIFVSGAAAITSLAILGAKILRSVPLGKAWLILMIGILIGTIGDLWYQHLEITGSYDTAHIVNLFWYASYWFIVYSLYKHGKIF